MSKEVLTGATNVAVESQRLTSPSSIDSFRTAECSKVKGKDKSIPLQAWTGPEDSKRLRLPDFKTFDT